MNKNSYAVILLAKHTKLISNQFYLSNYQTQRIWSQAVLEEVSYVLLITYVNLTLSNDVDNAKKQHIDTVVDQWSGVMTGFFNTDNTPQTRMAVKKKLNEKSQKYTAIIDNILGERLNNNTTDEIEYKYQLYELFLEEMLANLDDIFCQRAEHGLSGAMNFINLSQDLDILHSQIFDEKSVVMLSLRYNDIDDITEHDSISMTNNQNKKDIRKRAITIRDGVINFLTDCIYHATQNNTDKRHINKSSHKNHSNDKNYHILDGILNPRQYFLSAIIPCFLILVINDSLYLFPPNISIPQFSMGTKIRELTLNQELGLWLSYLLAVANLLYLQVKRLRDSDSNVWLCLVSFIPFFGSLFAIALAIDGQFPSNHGKQKDMGENDPFMGLSLSAHTLSLLIFLGIWLTATPT